MKRPPFFKREGALLRARSGPQHDMRAAHFCFGSLLQAELPTADAVLMLDSETEPGLYAATVAVLVSHHGDPVRGCDGVSVGDLVEIEHDEVWLVRSPTECTLSSTAAAG